MGVMQRFSDLSRSGVVAGWVGGRRAGWVGVFMCVPARTCELPVCAIKPRHPSVPHECGKVGAKAGVNVG